MSTRRSVRQTIRRGTYLQAVVESTGAGLATVRFPGAGGRLTNLRMIGGLVSPGDTVIVDASCGKPFVRPERLTEPEVEHFQLPVTPQGGGSGGSRKDNQMKYPDIGAAEVMGDYSGLFYPKDWPMWYMNQIPSGEWVTLHYGWDVSEEMDPEDGPVCANWWVAGGIIKCPQTGTVTDIPISVGRWLVTGDYSFNGGDLSNINGVIGLRLVYNGIIIDEHLANMAGHGDNMSSLHGNLHCQGIINGSGSLQMQFYQDSGELWWNFDNYHFCIDCELRGQLISGSQAFPL